MRPKLPGKGFTLIELLIVVAIIAILAAIAVPNFLEAQVRAKITRTFSDMRACSIAIETYRVDNQALPAVWVGDPLAMWLMAQQRNVFYSISDYPGRALTTPLAYMTSIPYDTWNTEMIRKDSEEWAGNHTNNVSFVFNNWTVKSTNTPGGVDMLQDFFRNQWAPYPYPGVVTYSLSSCGPDLRWWNRYPNEMIYNPTNGTLSPGDIYTFDNARLFPKQ